MKPANDAQDFIPRLSAAPVVAVVTFESVEEVEPVVNALREGGIRSVEVAQRTPASLEALARVRKNAPDFLLGAGTVLTQRQVEDVVAAGADFVLAPGLDADTVEHCLRLGVPCVPGVATASEIQLAWRLGARCLKFFPAETLGGVDGLRTLSVPFAHLGLSFLPLGGIREETLGAYLKLPSVAAVGGSWIAPPDLIRKRAWEEILRRARSATSLLL